MKATPGRKDSDRLVKTPNILWILLDDSSADMFGFGGASWATPQIDRLAREGVRADECHTSSPICTPSRFGYLSGKHPARCGAERFRKPIEPGGQHHVGFNVEFAWGDSENAAAVFRAAGYRTGFVGKFHVGPSEGFHSYDSGERPDSPETARKLTEDYARKVEHLRSIGFEEVGAVCWSNTDDRALTALRQHNLEWQTTEALRFLESDDERPFFLFVAPTTQHGPHHVGSLESDPRIVEHGLLPEAPSAVQPPRASVLERVRDVTRELRHLAAGAVWTDDMVGAMIGALERSGQLDETIIVFGADHGPGTRSGKFTLYDGGTRVPLLIRHPRLFQPGSRCAGQIANVDLLPTLLEAAGLAVPDWACDGRSALETLRDGGAGREELYLDLGFLRAVRTKKWKHIALRYPPSKITAMRDGQTHSAFLAVRGEGGDPVLRLYPHYFDADQLYDLEAEPGEQRNLAEDPRHKGVLEEMRARLALHTAKFPDPFPLEPDSYQISGHFRDLTARNFADLSYRDWPWYRELAW